MIDYTITAGNGFLNVTDNTNNVFNDFYLLSIRVEYTKDIFLITDCNKTLKLAVANLSKINSGAFATFEDLQLFIREAQIAAQNNLKSIAEQVNDSGTATLSDTQLVPIIDGTSLLKATWSSIKAFLKSYFDTKYSTFPIYNGADGVNVTGTTANTITYAELIDSDLITDNSIFDLICKFDKTGTAGTLTLRAYINTVNNLSTGSPINIFTSAALGNTVRTTSFQRYINIKKKNGTGDGTKMLNISGTSLIDTGVSSTTIMSSFAINYNIPQYLIISVQLSIASDSVKGISLVMKK